MSEPDGKTAGRAARQLIRRAVKASLATVGGPDDGETAGWPAAALVTVAHGWDASPILLLSTLAHHSRNLAADPRAALLIDGTARFANPQAGPRVSVMGRVARTDEDGLARRFLARHPRAKAYASFGDFSFYRMAVERLHWVGGFARAQWIDAPHAVLPAHMCDTIEQHELDILRHMNEDHADALALYGRRLAGARGKRFTLIAVDPEGFDLRVGAAVHRIEFPEMVTDVDSCRAAFVALAERARTHRTA